MPRQYQAAGISIHMIPLTLCRGSSCQDLHSLKRPVWLSECMDWSGRHRVKWKGVGPAHKCFLLHRTSQQSRAMYKCQSHDLVRVYELSNGATFWQPCFVRRFWCQELGAAEHFSLSSRSVVPMLPPGLCCPLRATEDLHGLYLVHPYLDKFRRRTQHEIAAECWAAGPTEKQIELRAPKYRTRTRNHLHQKTPPNIPALVVKSGM